MDSIDLDAIVNPWQALVVVVLIFAVLVLPSLFSWLNSRQAKHAAREARDVMHHESKPNSGSSMRDSLDRIEDNLTKVVARVEVLEQAAERRGGRLSWRR